MLTQILTNSRANAIHNYSYSPDVSKMASATEKQSQKGGQSNVESLAKLVKTPVKEIIKGSDKRDFWQAMVKKGTSEAVKAGLVNAGLSANTSEGIADQYTVAYELVLAAKKGKGKISPGKLAEILAMKGLGIAKIADKNNIMKCGISAGYVGISASKTVGLLVATEASGGATGGALIAEVGELMYTVYQMDESCGISKTVKSKIDSAAQSAASSMYYGVMEALSRGSL
ncbi:hypothetical protein J2X36_002649 [Methylobacterium sp. BE186]|uniref:hypothetical protein n=1 Tax=Methylobacterium sp. BE186 TaxID=2817715 RepID=UPI00286063D9|nr:hypothetical protein [Methylobacterium sp. BE186]MDR7037896.1 hypothetical protein [Methylobacterium sp. BE186]